MNTALASLTLTAQACQMHTAQASHMHTAPGWGGFLVWGFGVSPNKNLVSIKRLPALKHRVFGAKFYCLAFFFSELVLTCMYLLLSGITEGFVA